MRTRTVSKSLTCSGRGQPLGTSTMPPQAIAASFSSYATRRNGRVRSIAKLYVMVLFARPTRSGNDQRLPSFRKEQLPRTR
jgi:hypothetical protein